MNAVQKIEQPDTTAQMVSVIERMASNPAVDVDKLERLLAMQERIVLKQAETLFNDAMTACQAEMRPISADAENPQTRSKYATYAKLDRALRPIYTKHGFSLSFDEGDSPKPEHVRVLCYVARGGFTRTYRRDMPADGKGARGGDVMTKTHATGAAGSYGARYILKGIFNVAVGEDDTDGNAPVNRIDASQAANVRALLDEVKGDEKAMLGYFKLKSVEDIPVHALKDVIASIERKRRK